MALTRREWIEIAFSIVVVGATFYVAPAAGINLPPEATGVVILGATLLFGDGSGDLLRGFSRRNTGDGDVASELDDRRVIHEYHR